MMYHIQGLENSINMSILLQTDKWIQCNCNQNPSRLFFRIWPVIWKNKEPKEGKYCLRVRLRRKGDCSGKGTAHLPGQCEYHSHSAGLARGQINWSMEQNRPGNRTTLYRDSWFTTFTCEGFPSMKAHLLSEHSGNPLEHGLFTLRLARAWVTPVDRAQGVSKRGWGRDILIFTCFQLKCSIYSNY